MSYESHRLYETGDDNAPTAIKDRNGEVVLGLCKDCGRAEVQLAQPCTGFAPYDQLTGIPDGSVLLQGPLYPHVERGGALANYFSTHMLALTREDLRSKSSIAAQLAARDRKLDVLLEFWHAHLQLMTALSDPESGVDAELKADERFTKAATAVKELLK